jgi:hypothetical protein
MARLAHISLAAIAMSAALAGCGGAGKPGDTRITTAGVSFDVPPTWEVVNGDALALIEGDPDAALRRKDGSAILTITKSDDRPTGLGPAGVALQRRLARAVPDLHAVQGSEVRTRAGKAYSFKLVRDQPEGPARVVEVPSGSGSYVLELSLQPRAVKAAGEVGRIVRSFDD